MFLGKRRLFFAVIIVVCLTVGAIVLFLKSRDNNPVNNPDYNRVVQLVEDKELTSTIRTALLPMQYQYLTTSGSIGLDTRITVVVLFNSSVSRGNLGRGYLYKADDQSPNANDFPPLPYPDSFSCERLQPRWFSCRYTWH